jgi:putative membrane protein
MLVKFSSNLPKQIIGIIYYNRYATILFTFLATAVWLIDTYTDFNLSIPVVPVTIMGGALAIFMSFKNNTAYDRWWEARKIWGGIVNSSRHLGTCLVAYIDPQDVENRLIRRHIGWLYALAMNLRKNIDYKKIEEYLGSELMEELKDARNLPTQILNIQGIQITRAHKAGLFNEFEHEQLMYLLKDFYVLQGKAERIKNTVFPFYYNYYTQIFLWLFIVLLPCSLVATMGWLCIPMTMAISFVFYTLDKSGRVTEDPFEDRAADTPMLSICRTIEIDLLQMAKAEDIPEPAAPSFTRFGATYYH